MHIIFMISPISRLIKFTVSAWCRRWPLDGAGYEIHKKSKMSPMSFTEPVIRYFTFSVSIIHIKFVAGAK